MSGELWKEIHGAPGYWVSDLGTVKSSAYEMPMPHGGVRKDKTRILKVDVRGGYPSVVLYPEPGVRLRKTVAHLVLTEFVGPRPDGMEACHNDGNANNSRLNNLRWDTRKNNHNDKRAHGTMLKAFPKRKLTPDAVREMRAHPEIGGAVFARKFGVSLSAVNLARKGVNWRHLNVV